MTIILSVTSMPTYYSPDQDSYRSAATCPGIHRTVGSLFVERRDSEFRDLCVLVGPLEQSSIDQAGESAAIRRRGAGVVAAAPAAPRLVTRPGCGR